MRQLQQQPQAQQAECINSKALLPAGFIPAGNFFYTRFIDSCH